MGSIKGSVSEVKGFLNDCATYYSAIFARAGELKSQASAYHSECEKNLSSIATQISRLHSIKSDVSAKVLNYKNSMDEAKAEVSRCQAEIHYIQSHPITIIEYDSEGNPYERQVIDQAALAAATQRRDEAMQVYRLYKAKYTEAKSVEEQVSKTIEDFQKLENAMKIIADGISKDIFEIEKNTTAVASESEHNLKSLTDVSDAMDYYANSKKFVIPPVLSIKNYTSNGGVGGISTGGGSSGGINPQTEVGDLSVNEVTQPSTAVSESGIDASFGGKIVLNYDGKEYTYDELIAEHDEMMKNTTAYLGYVERPKATTSYIDSKVSLSSIVIKTLHKITSLADKDRYKSDKRFRYFKHTLKLARENSGFKKFIFKRKYRIDEKIRETIHNFSCKITDSISKEVRNIQLNQYDLKSYISIKFLAKAIVKLPEKILKHYGYEKPDAIEIQEKIDERNEKLSGKEIYNMETYFEAMLHYLKVAIPYKINKFKENREFKRKKK